MNITFIHSSSDSNNFIEKALQLFPFLKIKSRTKQCSIFESDVNITTDIKTAIRNFSISYATDLIISPHEFNPTQIKILAIDMDSTLINIECIDEIAREVGLEKEVSKITELTMNGEIKDFSESLKLRVKLLKGVPLSALEHVYNNKLKFNPGAVNLLSSAKLRGWKTILVSGGFDFFTNQLKEKLNFNDAFANQLEIVNGSLTGGIVGTIIDGKQKAEIVGKCALKYGYTTKNALVIGDGANDLPMMSCAGLSIGYRAKTIVKEKADGFLDFAGLDSILSIF
ncbi:MAG: phosphoserine phosphatase SerB [Betaproteobacteria bacterium]